jgi:hypothetical protein
MVAVPIFKKEERLKGVGNLSFYNYINACIYLLKKNYGGVLEL